MLMSFRLALQALTGCHPELARALAEGQEGYGPEPLPRTVAMGTLGQALVDRVDAMSDADRAAVAQVIEELLGPASWFGDAVATGLLEAVVARGDRDDAIARVVAALGPRARDYLRVWERVTGGRAPGL